MNHNVIRCPRCAAPVQNRAKHEAWHTAQDGAADVTCQKCGGDGQDHGAIGVLPRARPCSACHGTGVDLGEDDSITARSVS